MLDGALRARPSPAVEPRAGPPTQGVAQHRLGRDRSVGDGRLSRRRAGTAVRGRGGSQHWLRGRSREASAASTEGCGCRAGRERCARPTGRASDGVRGRFCPGSPMRARFRMRSGRAACGAPRGGAAAGRRRPEPPVAANRTAAASGRASRRPREGAAGHHHAVRAGVDRTDRARVARRRRYRLAGKSRLWRRARRLRGRRRRVPAASGSITADLRSRAGATGRG